MVDKSKWLKLCLKSEYYQYELYIGEDDFRHIVREFDIEIHKVENRIDPYFKGFR